MTNQFIELNEQLNKILNERAAMYKSNQPTFDDFYNYIIKNPKCKKCYFQMTAPFNVRIPSDTILHDYKKHNISLEHWQDLIFNFDNIQNACISKDKLASSKANVYLCRIVGKHQYGVSLQIESQYNQITTMFIDHPNTIDNWIKTSSAGGLTSQLSASDTSKGSSVTQSSQNSTNIIQYIKEKIKP